jgi:phenylacetate-CoA ligase
MNAIRLRQLILDAAEHVPFYRQHWKAAGVDLTRIGSAVHLEFLPVVRKADLLNCAPEMRLDQRFLAQPLRGESTSGSTGRPFEMPIDHLSLRRRRWRFLDALRDVGYVPGEKLMLISDPPFPKGARFLRWTYADLRRGEADVFATYARTRPHVLYGPLSSLVLLARRMLDTPQVTHRPKLVVSTAEQLTDAQRTLLETAFSARVSDFYGMTELGLVAYSKPGISGYKVHTNDFHIETLRAGATGFERLVVTDLGGGAMPLIRFDTGDLVRRSSKCADAPIVQVSGREVDCLKLANGGYVSPYEVTLALDRVGGIRQYQVVQQNDLSVDLYVAPNDADEFSVLDKARQVLASICGGVTAINVHQREEEPVRFDQKQRVVCSHVMA